MIIKIDHIGMLSNNFREDINMLEKLGYRQSFMEENILNVPIKKELMYHFSQNQSLSLLTHKSNIDIELIEYGHNSKRYSYITPIFNVFPESMFQNKEKKCLIDGFEYGTFEYFDIPIIISSQSKERVNEFNEIIVYTSCKKESILFWEQFGFQWVKDIEEEILEFKSILQETKKFRMRLMEKDNLEEKYYLDDIGLNCIAFISTSLERDRLKLLNINITVSDINLTKINNKELKVCFIVGPSGELVELIGL